MIVKKLSLNKILTSVVIIIIISIIILGLCWVNYLKITHSSFENYYKFRNCIQLIEKTDTYGICKISSGKIIKIVKYQDKWYLDGDLPSSGLNFL
jgi:hypothetical protein